MKDFEVRMAIFHNMKSVVSAGPFKDLGEVGGLGAALR